MKKSVLFFLVLIACCSCSLQKKNDAKLNAAKNRHYRIHSEFKPYFDACGVDGSIVIFDRNRQEWLLSDTLGAMAESLPASTFKIINLLIALETKTIKDENEIVAWVGKTDTVKYGYRPEIYHDMPVKEAFEVSAGWVFIELAKKIGRDNYKKYLKACNYGNLNLSENGPDFWNFGDFGISPVNQVQFLKDLYEGKLPFSQHNIEILKRVMVTEKTDDFTIRAKTGWTRDKGMNTGWWVGCLETGKDTIFFATRLLQDRKNNRADFGSCRKAITKKILTDLGYLHSSNEQAGLRQPLFQSIDHVPVVVRDLEKVKSILKNQLGFTIKEGKPHEGINNCFIKFEDGTYLEFIHPTDSLPAIGRYYTQFLKKRQGGTQLALAINNTDPARQMLYVKGIPFTSDSNKIWRTIEPEAAEFFLIEYADKNKTDQKIHTTHPNTAASLTAVYVVTGNPAAEERKYESMGIKATETGLYLETPYTRFTIGHNHLYLLDGSKSKKIGQWTNLNNLRGICGFQIKLGSLQILNKLVKQRSDINYDSNSATICLKDYNLFLRFTE